MDYCEYENVVTKALLTECKEDGEWKIEIYSIIQENGGNTTPVEKSMNIKYFKLGCVSVI